MIVKIWMQPKCPSVDERVHLSNELLYIFYKDRSLAFPTTWLELIDIMLSEISEIWNDIY